MKNHQWFIAMYFTFLVLLFGFTNHFKSALKQDDELTPDESFNRGKNLVFNICGQCHYNPGVNKFIGMPMHDLPKFMGKVYSANLTSSLKYGAITKYTNEELIYLIKTGTAKDGRFIPYMVRPNLSDQDLRCIVEYLRSDDLPVLAGDTSVGKTKLSAMGKLAVRFTGKPLPYISGMKTPPDKDSIAVGRYLADNIGCYHCHSGSILSLDYLHPEKSKRYMQGGMEFKNSLGMEIRAANLTPDVATGIGAYTQQDFRKAVREGVDPSGRKLHYPMRKYNALSDQQMDALYAYLKSLAPVSHKIKKI
jgi:hypothetical protein